MLCTSSPNILKPNLIAPRPRHIPHPLHTPIIALLKNLQIPHQQPRTRKHQQTKAQTQRRPTPRLLVRHARQTRLRRQHKLALAREPRDLPHDVVLLGLVFRFALGDALGDPGCVERRGDAHDDVRGEELAAVVGFDGDAVFDFRLAYFIDDSVHFEREVHVLRRAVAHQFELAVGRYEGDDAVGVELPELDALVELAVFERDAAGGCFRGFCAGGVAGGSGEAVAVEEEAVVETEFAFGRAGEVGSHDDLAVDVGAEDGACGGHEEVHVLDYVYEGFVFSISDVGASP